MKPIYVLVLMSCLSQMLMASLTVPCSSIGVMRLPDNSPVAICQNITVVLDGSGNAQITATMVDNGSSAVNGIASLTISPSQFSCANVGPNTVILTVTDLIGNSSTCQSTVMVEDNDPPTIDCGYQGLISRNSQNFPTTSFVNDVVIPNDPGLCGAVLVYDNIVDDNCSFVQLTQLSGLPSGSTFPVGTTTNTFEVVDGNGNTAICSFNVTVVDQETPTIICPANTVVNTLFGSCDGFTSLGVNDFDNCGSTSLTQIAGLSNGSLLPVGTTTNTFVSTDASGNSASCSFTVTVEDHQAPSIPCPSNITTNTSPYGNFCGAMPFFIVNQYDNCLASTLVQTSGLPIGSIYPVGTTSNAYIATDAAGNTSTCAFSITVIDNTPPTATCQNITVNLTSGAVSVPPSAIGSASTDNCGIASLSVNPSTFTCASASANLPTELFISEYIEGSSNNGCIEIFNGTAAPVNMALYNLQFYLNGSSSPNLSISLSGTLATMDVYVVCRSTAAQAFLAVADLLNSSSAWPNGNDAVVLRRGNTIIDIVGTVGQNPGPAWVGGGLGTLDRTLVRKPLVRQGNTANLPGFPSLNTEWTGFPIDYSGNLGTHSFDLGANSVILTATDLSGNTSTCTANVSVQMAGPTVTGDSRCGPGPVTLAAVPGSGGDVVRWYTAQVGGTLLFQGNSYTANFVSSQTLYVTTYSTGDGCESPVRTPVPVTINTLPFSNAGQDTSICLGECYQLDGVYSASTYNFDNGPQGWTTVSAGPTCQGSPSISPTWAWQSFGFSGGSMGTPSVGDPNSPENSYVLSPPLAFGSTVTVNFRSWSNNESGYPCNYDVEFVELSTDGGSSWIPMHAYDPVLHSYGNAQWQSLSYTLLVTPSTNGRLRFRYDTGDGCCGPVQNHPGWYLDDVEIISGNQSSSTIAWTPATGLNCTNCSNPVACPDTTTAYIFEVATSGGCVTRDTMVLTVNRATGDDICQAISLSSGTPQPFSNVCATVETDEPAPSGGDCNSQTTWCDSTLEHTVWFSFQAPASGCVSLLIDSMVGTGQQVPNFRMAVWSGADCGDLSGLELVAANDDGGQNLAPVITELHCLAPGATYFVQIDGYNGFVGTGVLRMIECSMPPFEPGFTTQPAMVNGNIDVCLNQPVYFQDTSSGVLTWLWEFGDAFVSSASSPSHSYQVAGTYAVQMTAAGGCGETAVLQATVTVSPEPGPEIQCASVVCEGDTTTYWTSSVCSNYAWTVSGGTIVSSPLNNDSIRVVWGPGTNGEGSVSLVVPGCGSFCAVPAFRIVPILPQQLDPTGPTEVCAGNAFHYSLPCIPGTEFTWNVSQEGILTAGQGSHEVTIYWNPNASGTATITVNYSNELVGCSGAGSLSVDVLQRFQVYGPQATCEGLPSDPFVSQQILGSNLVNASWSVVTPAQDTLPNLQSSSSSFVYDFTDGPGTYEVIATVPSSTYCNLVSSQLVTVVGSPPPPLTIAGDSIVCPGGSYTYTSGTTSNGYGLQWTVAGGSAQSNVGNSIVVTWGQTGPYHLSVRQQTLGSPVCSSDSVEMNVSGYPPLSLPAISGDSSLCYGSIGQYGIPGPLNPDASYSWAVNPSNLGSITSSNGGTSITVQWASSGTQTASATVELTINYCGSHIVSFPVQLQPLPSPQIGLPSLACAGQSLGFTSPAGAAWAWTFGDGGTASIQNPQHTYTAAGTYTLGLTMTNAAGCQASASSTLTVLPVPVLPVVTGPNTFCGAATATYGFSQAVSPGANYSWNLQPAQAGTIVSSSPDAVTVQWATPSATVNAQVVLSLTSTCLTTTVAYPVTIDPLPQPVITSPSSICAGASAAFSAPAAGSWAWTFGDGGTASVQNPSHTYTAAGSYTVTLNMTNAQGCQASQSTTVTVSPVATLPVITGQGVFCGGGSATYTFLQPIAQGATYIWSISTPGAGTIQSSTSNSATIQWNAPLADVNTTVVVTVTSPCFNGQASLPVTLHALPVASLSYPPFLCSGAAAQFTGSGGSSWAWTFGDGGTATQQNPAHTYTQAGTYTASLTVTDLHGCQATASAPIVVNPTPVEPVVTGTQSFCGAHVATYSFAQPILTSANYIWSITPVGAGTIVSGNGTSSITVQWANPQATVNAQVLLDVQSSCLQSQASLGVVLYPAAAVTMSLPALACTGDPVQFAGSAAAAWQWDFGDGGTATVQNPVHVYASSGEYPIDLLVTDANGCTATTVDTITVLPVPVIPVVTGPIDVCGGNVGTYLFTQSVSPGAVYSWIVVPSTAGNILTSSSSGITIKWNPSSVDVAATVSLTVNSACLSTQVDYPVMVHALPQASISFPAPTCAGRPFAFGGSGGGSYAWDFADGGISSLQNPTHTYQQPGTYSVTLVVTDAYGCQGNAQAPVPIDVTPQVPVIQGDSLLCGGGNVVYHFTQPLLPTVGYIWNIVPANAGTIVSGYGNDSVVVEWANPAASLTAEVVLDVIAYCENPQVRFPVVLHPAASASVDLPEPACAGQSAAFAGSGAATWLWDFGDGATSTLQNPTHTYNNSGRYAVRLSTTDANGCTAQAMDSLEVDAVPVVPVIAGPANSCAGATAIYSFSQAVTPKASYKWSVLPSTAGVVVATGSPSSIEVRWGIVTAPTTVTVVLDLNSTCLQTQVSYQVTLYPKPSSNFTFNSPVCTGTQVPFVAAGGTSWQWNFGDGGTSTLQSTTHSYSTAGYYTVMMTATENGCSATRQVYVDVLSAPEAPVITGNTPVCVGAQASYSFLQPASLNANYIWQVLPSGAGSIEQGQGGSGIVVRWNLSGPAFVVLSTTSACLNAQDTFPVIVNPQPPISIGVTTPVCQGAPTQFSGPPAASWNWTFEGGGTSTLQNPQVVFPDLGVFRAWLTIADANGCSNDAQTSFLVNPSPIARIYGPCNDDCMPMRYCIGGTPTTTLSALNGLGYQFAWQPGNFSNSPTATITGPGTYYVEVTNVYGCTATSAPVTLLADSCLPNSCIPEAHVQDFTFALNVPSCTQVDFNYQLSSNMTFVGFEFGDGATTTQMDPSHDYAYPGTYCPTLVATVPDSLHPGSVCTLRVCHNLIIPILADFFTKRTCGMGVWSVECNDLATYYGNNVIDVWEWYVDGGTSPIATGPYPTLSLAPGTHTISLKVTSTATGATCTKSKSISLPFGPTANFSFVNPTCANHPTGFTNLSTGTVVPLLSRWDFYNDNTATATLPYNSYSYPAAGNFQVSLNVVDVNGCTDKKVLPITVVPNISGAITASGPTTFCNGESVVLTAPLGSSYLWSTGATTQSITVTTAGDYGVTVISANGCPYVPGGVHITVRPFPDIIISGSHQYCQGGWIDLGVVASNLQYVWEFDNQPIDGNWVTVGSGEPDLQIPASSTTLSGNYRVTVSDFQNVCSITTAPFAVSVDSVPPGPYVMGISGPTTFCAGGSVTLTAPQGVGYLWSTGSTAPSITVGQTGSYAVTVSTLHGCAYGPPQVPVTTNPRPVAEVSGRTTYCTGELLELRTPPGPYDFVWEFDNFPINGTYISVGSNNALLTLPLTQTLLAGNYRVRVINPLTNCEAVTAPVLVSIGQTPPVPTVAASGPLSFCQGDSVVLTASGNGNYFWSTGSTSTSITVIQSGTYSVNSIGSGGCIATSQPVAVVASPVPVAVVTGVSTYCAGDLLNLQTPAGPYTYQWEYDSLPINGNYLATGGNSAVLQQVVPTAGSSGNYHVKVTHLTSGCYTVSGDIAVTVNAMPAIPVVTASGPTAICQGSSLTLTASGSGPLLWSTGDTAASIVVQQAGVFSVTAQGQGGCNVTSAPVTVSVLPVPTAAISGRSNYCEGEAFLLQTNPGPYTYVWEYDSLPIDGNYAAVPGNSFGLSLGASTVAMSGNYRVTATHNVNGCSVTSAPFSVTVNPVPATPVISASGPLVACQGTVVTLSASGNGPFLWSNGSTTASIAVSQSGTFSVNVTGAGGCQATSASLVVTIHPVPSASVSGASSYCVGEALHLQTTSGPYTFQWECDTLPIDGNYISVGTNSPNLQFTLGSTAMAGNYRVRVTSPTSGCYVVSPDYAVAVHAVPSVPVITASGPTALCQGSNVTLTSSSGTGNLWSTGATTQSIVVSQAGTYSVTVMGQGGCQSSSNPVAVTVSPLPVAVITGASTYCTGGLLDLHTVAGPYSYQWSYDSLPIDGNYVNLGSNSRDLQIALTSASQSGNYRVTAVANGSGCTTISADFAVTVNTSPSTPVIAASGPLTVCQGGSVTLTAPNADTYAWSSGASTQSVTVAQSGTFAVTVANAFGCQAASSSVAVTVNPLPPATVQGQSTYCQGASLQLQAPTGSYSYQWQYDSLPIDAAYLPVGGNSASLQFPLSTTALSGNYRVVVTQTGTGCAATSPVFPVTVYPVPQQPVIDTVGSTVFCQGDSVTLTAPQGASYYWSDGEVSQTITVKHSGNFAVTVTTVDGCTFSAGPVAVVEHPLPVAAISGATTYCSDETIMLSTASGYEYDWHHDPLPIDGNYVTLGLDSATVEITATLAASGNYVVIATDSITGCMVQSAPFAITVNQSPATPVIASTSSGTLCADELWTLTVTNPEPGATYTWSTGQVGTSIVALMQGSYSVVSSFANGCSRVSNTLVLNPKPVLECLPTGCYSHCISLGPLDIAGPAGYAVYEWLQEPGQVVVSNAMNFSVSQSGSYRLRVTNSFGCSATSEVFDISFIDCCSTFVATSEATDLTCYQWNNGAATVLASGGLEPYTYQWSNGYNSPTIQNLAAGSYSWTVTDQNNCVLDSVVSVAEPDELVVNANYAPILCNGGTTEVVLTASGGTPPYSGVDTFTLGAGYQFLWVTDTNGCWAYWQGFLDEPQPLVAWAIAGSIACQGDSTIAVVTASGGTGVISGTGSFTVSHGVHHFTVTDGNGCTAVATVEVVPQSDLTAAVSYEPILCHGGTTTIHLTATGGNPPYQNTGNFVVGAGTYSYQVADANGCMDTILLVIPEPDPLTASATAGTILCHGGTTIVTVTASGGTEPFSGTGTFVLGAGAHTFTVTDANGCTATTGLILTEPNELTVVASASAIPCYGGTTTVTVTTSGGLGPFAYIWSNGATAQDQSGLSAGTYCVTVTDQCGQPVNTCVTVSPQPDVTAPEITCPGSIIVSNDPGQCGAVATFAAIASDDCGTPSISYSPASGSSFPVGTTTVTATATDGGGNTASCDFTVTVNDTEAPVVVCQNYLVELGPNSNGMGITYGQVTSSITDNCGVDTMSITQDFFTCAMIGQIIPVVATATDIYGNSSTCTATVTVVDNAAPVAVCQNVTLTNGGTVTAAQVGGNSTDNCGIASMALSQSSFGCNNEGANTVVLTVTDQSGNSSTCTATVTVNVAPITVSLSSPVNSCGYNVSSCCNSGNGGGSGGGSGSGHGDHGSGSGNHGSGNYGSGSSHGDHGSGSGNHGSGSGSGNYGSGSSHGDHGNHGNCRHGGGHGNGNCGSGNLGGSHGHGNCGSGNLGGGHGNGNCGSGNLGSGHGHGNLGSGNLGSGHSHGNCGSGNLGSGHGHGGCGNLGSGHGHGGCGSGNIGHSNCGQDGSINLTASGGCGNLTYLWSNGATTANLIGLTPGLYVVTVTDGNGNTSTASITLTQAAQLTASVSVQHISCYGGHSGSATAHASGGCAPYAYLWSNGATSQTIHGLGVGSYTVTVTDGYGCTATASGTVAQPTRLVADAGSHKVVYPAYPPQACATLTGTVTGGTPAYTVRWTTRTGQLLANGYTYNACPTVTTVYYFRATDANDCSTVDSVAVCPRNITCGNNKVQICHTVPGRYGCMQNQCIPVSQVASHLSHGDLLGSCGTNANCTFPNSHGGNGNGNCKTGDDAAGAHDASVNMSLRAFPNPTSGDLNVELACQNCNEDRSFTIVVSDIYGKRLAEVEVTMAAGEASTKLDLSQFANGVYLIAVDNGAERLVERIVKQ